MKKKSELLEKIIHWFLNFHKEVLKTNAIGKKMLTASRTNAHLKDTYEELGRLLEKAVESGEVNWNSPKMQGLLHTIKACRKDLVDLENKMNKIKFSIIQTKND